ncbi:MAG: TIR domain-containing protein, partial [Nitrosarchaeum sp.]
MDNAIKDRIIEFANDVAELKKSSNSIQNEIWSNQIKQLLDQYDILDSDLKDFERLFNEMRYATATYNSKSYDAMMMFLRLLSRKDFKLKQKKIYLTDTPRINPDFMKTLSLNSKPRQQEVADFPTITPTKNRTKEIFKSLVTGEPNRDATKSNKVFIVHGSDNAAKLELAELVRKMGLEPIILHQQANKGKTLIEKFEEHAGEANFAFVLFTPDDVGGKDSETLKPRARQNAILEFGYFLAKLGRNKVCCLHKKGVELPSDMDG